MGVWIETCHTCEGRQVKSVTPFVGVWIETRSLQHHNRVDGVTPFVGVWIETLLMPLRLIWLSGHTLRGCVD